MSYRGWIAGFFLGLAGCGSDPAVNCDLAAKSAELAGVGAIDCGVVPTDADGTTAWQCAIDHYRAGEAFFVIAEDTGTDSLLADALVYNGVKTWKLHTDSEDEGHEIVGWDCVDPVENVEPDDIYTDTDAHGFAILECTSQTPEGTSYQVCGEICDGCSSTPRLPFEP